MFLFIYFVSVFVEQGGREDNTPHLINISFRNVET